MSDLFWVAIWGLAKVVVGVTSEKDLRPEAEPLLLPDYVTASLRDMCPDDGDAHA